MPVSTDQTENKNELASGNASPLKVKNVHHNEDETNIKENPVFHKVSCFHFTIYKESSSNKGKI